MRRFTLDLIKRAYEETGLYPIQEAYGDVSLNCGCPLTAIALMENKEKGLTLEDILTKMNKLDGHFFQMTDTERKKRAAADIQELFGPDINVFYALGFVNGYDDYPECSMLIEIFGSESVLSYRAGYSDGMAVQRELFHNASAEEAVCSL